MDEITSEYRSPAPSKQRKAAAAAEKKKQIPEEEDEDYQPKLTPGQSSSSVFLLKLWVSIVLNVL